MILFLSSLYRGLNNDPKFYDNNDYKVHAWIKNLIIFYFIFAQCFTNIYL